MEPQLTSEKPTEQVTDVKEDMKSFLAKETGQVEKQEDDLPEESSELEQKEPETPDEEEKEPEDKEEEEDEKEEKEEKKDEDKKRPNRYQKQKAKIQALEVQVKKLTTDLSEAIRIAHVLDKRAKAFAKKYQEDFVRWQQGQLPTDAEQENWVLKARQEEKEEADKLTKQQESELAKAEIIREKQEMAVNYQSEALELADTAGLTGKERIAFARKVLVQAAVEARLGNKVTLKQVAEELAPRLKTKRQVTPDEEQFAMNDRAPKLVQKGKGRIPNYNIEGKDSDSQKTTMLSFLESRRGK